SSFRLLVSSSTFSSRKPSAFRRSPSLSSALAMSRRIAAASGLVTTSSAQTMAAQTLMTATYGFSVMASLSGEEPAQLGPIEPGGASGLVEVSAVAGDQRLRPAFLGGGNVRRALDREARGLGRAHRHAHLVRRDAEVEVGAEPLRVHVGAEVPVRAGDDPHVERRRRHRAGALHLA